MSAYGILLMLTLIIVGSLLYLREKRKKSVIKISSVGNMFQQIEDNIHPPTKQELQCRKITAEKKGNLKGFIIHSMAPVIRGFDEEMEAMGFILIAHTEIDFAAELNIKIEKASLKLIHEKMDYPKSTKDYREANLAFIKAKICEWFGDKDYSGGFQEIEDCPSYIITYFIHNLEGKAREMLGEEFFIRLAELSKEYVGSEEARIAAEVAAGKN
jgi:hypothetical protein